MEKAIREFSQQFTFTPEIERADALPDTYRTIVVVGMGGSHLNGDVLKALDPELPLIIHSDYGLPNLPHEEMQEALFVIASYSGNTEEVLDALEQVHKNEYNAAALSTGGKLKERAAELGIPFVAMPDIGIQPRSALGFSTIALAHLLGRERVLRELKDLSGTLDAENIHIEGEVFAGKISGYVPLIYTSRRNHALAYNWKIKFNETAKIPSFCNVLPELNHNEMTGFDVVDSTRPLAAQFAVIFLMDDEDDERIQNRMRVTQEIYANQGVTTHTRLLAGESRAERLFSSLLFADWTALMLSEMYGTEPEEVPLVEEFKRKIS